MLIYVWPVHRDWIRFVLGFSQVWTDSLKLLSSPLKDRELMSLHYILYILPGLSQPFHSGIYKENEVCVNGWNRGECKLYLIITSKSYEVEFLNVPRGGSIVLGIDGRHGAFFSHFWASLSVFLLLYGNFVDVTIILWQPIFCKINLMWQN